MAKPQTGSPIPTNLRRLRQARGLTQAQLAEASDVADATLSRIERGRFAPSQDLLTRLAAALETSEASLLARDRPDPKPKLRQCEAKLVAVVKNWDDSAVDDLVRALKLIVSAADRNAGPAEKPTSPRRRARNLIAR